MKEHLRRSGWLYAVCLAVAAWPAAMARLQRVPPLDLETVRKTAAWADAEVARLYGKPMSGEFQALEAKADKEGDFAKDLRVQRLVEVGPWTPALEPDLEAAQRNYGAALDEADALGRQGVWYVPFAEFFGQLPDSRPVPAEEFQRIFNRFYHSPKFYATRARAQWSCALASRDAARGDWPSALVELEKAAHVGDSSRPAGLIGLLIAAYARAVAYGGYASLLSADLPEEVERAALQALVQLRGTDPRLNALVRWTENQGALITLFLSSPGSSLFSPDPLYLFAAVDKAAGRAEAFADPSLRAWAQRFRRRWPATEAGGVGSFVAGMRSGGLRWTTLPSAVKWLKKAAATEPALLQDSIAPAEMRPGLDPWTLAFLSGSFWGGNLENICARGRTVATRGRLLEIAFAARLYRREHGRWPESLEELIPDYLPPIVEPRPSSPAERPAVGESAGPYAPFQIAWRDVDEPLRAALWSQALPLQGPWQPKIKASGAESIVEWRGEDVARDSLWSEQPAIPLALAELLRAHPKLVTEAQALGSDSPNPRNDQWQPLDPDRARRVTDETDAEQWSAAFYNETTLPPDKRGANRPAPAPRTVDLPKRVRLTARLQAPQKALVAWSPGPDGVDDAGRLAYDPTNGSTSRGDILAFPEGY